MALIFVLYMLFAAVFTIGKTALEYSQPLFLVGTRMLFAGALLIGFLAIFRRERLRYQPGSIWRLIRLGLINIYLTNALEFWGLKYLTSFKTCFIYSLSPFLSALLSYFVFYEKMTPKKWLGLLIGFLGFIPILLTQGSDEQTTGGFFIFSWAELAVMGAAASSVYGWIILRQLVKDDGYSPLAANGFSMCIGGVAALFHSLLTEPWNPVPVSDPIPFLICTAALLIVSNLMAYNLYGHLLKTYTAPFMSFAGFTTPLFTAILGWFFLGETVTKPFYISAVIVFTGLWLFHQEELNKKGLYTKEPSDQIPLQQKAIEN